MLKIDKNSSSRDGSKETCYTLWDRKSECKHSEIAPQELDILRDALCNKVLAIKDMVLQELKRKEQSYRKENKDLKIIATLAKTKNSDLKRTNIEKDLALLQLTLQLKNIKETVKGEEIAILKLKMQVKSIVELKTENTKLRSPVFVLEKQKKSIQELYCETTKELENALINPLMIFITYGRHHLWLSPLMIVYMDGCFMDDCHLATWRDFTRLLLSLCPPLVLVLVVTP